jgi:hypothetical protein
MLPFIASSFPRIPLKFDSYREGSASNYNCNYAGNEGNRSKANTRALNRGFHAEAAEQEEFGEIFRSEHAHHAGAVHHESAAAGAG